MVDSLINLLGIDVSSYSDLAVGIICGVLVVYVFTSLMNILQSFFKG